MITHKISDAVRGKTIRLKWTEGPTIGTSQTHHFHHDGTVDWHSSSDDRRSLDTKAGGSADEKTRDRPRYAAMKITYDVCVISYLAKSGYTLTVALNFSDGTTAGVASNEKSWTPVKGTFEVMH